MNLNAQATGFKLNFDSYCMESQSSEERYGDWSSVHSNSLEQVNITSDFPDLVSSLLFTPGDKVYVVWCEWSEGDSFGTAENAGAEGVGIFKDHQSANQLSEWISDRYNHYEADIASKTVRKLITVDGQEFSFDGYMPWEGYFESLDGVHIKELWL